MIITLHFPQTVAFRQQWRPEDLQGFDVLVNTQDTTARSARKRQNRAALKHLQALEPGSDELVATSTPGVSIKRGKTAEDFVLVFGGERQARSIGSTIKTPGPVTLLKNTDGSKKITVSGELSFKLTTDFAMEFTGFMGLQSFKNVVETEVGEKLTFAGDFDILNDTVGKNGINIFDPELPEIKFFVGLVPVVFQPPHRAECQNRQEQPTHLR